MKMRLDVFVVITPIIPIEEHTFVPEILLLMELVVFHASPKIVEIRKRANLVYEIILQLIANGMNGHIGLVAPVETQRKQRHEGECQKRSMEARNVRGPPNKQKSAIQITVQNANGMNGLSGHLVVKLVVMEAHKFDEEANHWKQVTQSVIVSENTEKKETAPSNSVVPRILMNVVKIQFGVNK